jgi:hypothetical protein
MYQIYIDESGHSGDVINWFKDLEQPIFVLCGIIVDSKDAVNLNNELKELYKSFKNEIKSTEEKFNYNLIKESYKILEKNKCKIIGEIVDKKYYYASRIVDTIIRMSYYYVISNDLMDDYNEARFQLIDNYYVHNRLAELIFNNLNEKIVMLYSHAVEKKNIESLKLLIKEIIKLKSDKIIHSHTRKIKKYLKIFLKRLDQIQEEEISLFIENVVLKADNMNGRKKKRVYICPHISSLANLKQRLINNYDEIEFFHDTQNEYSTILRNYLNLYEDKEFSINFIDSKNNCIIQAVDMFAGTLMRYSKELLLNSDSKCGYLDSIKKMGVLSKIDANIVAKSAFIIKYRNSIEPINSNFVIANYKHLDEMDDNYRNSCRIVHNMMKFN